MKRHVNSLDEFHRILCNLHVCHLFLILKLSGPSLFLEDLTACPWPVLNSVPRGWYPPKRPPLHQKRSGVVGAHYQISVFKTASSGSESSSNRISSGITNHKISETGPLWRFTRHLKKHHEPLDRTSMNQLRFSPQTWPIFFGQLLALHQQCPVEQQHLCLHSLGWKSIIPWGPTNHLSFAQIFSVGFFIQTNRDIFGYLGRLNPLN